MCEEDSKPISERPVIIQKDRIGRYYFIPVHYGLKDCCGFVAFALGKKKGYGRKDGK